MPSGAVHPNRAKVQEGVFAWSTSTAPYALYVLYTGSGWVKNACMMCSAIM